ncbi:MAG: insulinase family protein [bacterium]|nr:insulinase family protein [bacterium]
MSVRIGGVALVAVGAALLSAAPVPPLPCTHFELPNGVRVLVSEKHDVPVVAVQAFVNNTGGMREGRYTGCGISHFIEHIAATMLKELGGVVNAYTTADHTCYHCETGVEDWERAAEAIGRCLYACPFDPVIVERERGVIAQEIRMGEEEPGRVNWYQLLETIFVNSPQRVPVIGYLDNLARVTREDLVAYYQERYAGNNIVVAIAGDVSAARAREVAERAFGAIPRRPETPALVMAEPRPLSPRVAVRHMPVQHAQVLLAWHAAPVGDPDVFAFDVLSRVLSEGESSLLVDEVRTRRQLVYGVSASTWVPWTGNALFIISFSCDVSNITSAVNAVIEVVQRLGRELVDERALQRARRSALLEYARTTQSASAIAATLANNLLAYGDAQFSGRYLAEIEAVRAGDLGRIVRTYCSTNAMTTAMILPLVATNVPLAASRGPSPVHQWLVTQLWNGVRIAIRQDMRTPLVECCLYLPGGLRTETPMNNGISTLCAAMLTKGTKTRDAASLARELDVRGARLVYEATRDAIRASASCAPDDLAFLFEALADTALNATFPEGELEKQRRLCLGTVAALRDAWNQEAMLNFNEVFFAGHPYAMPLAGASNALASVTREELVQYHGGLLQPSNVVIAVAGACDPRRVLGLCERYFGHVRGVAPALGCATAFKPHPPRPFVSYYTPRAQATLVLGGPAPRVTDENMPVFAVLRAMLGGLNGIVFHALRGTTNIAYVVTSAYLSEPEGGALVTMAQCAPRDVGLALVRITNVLVRLAVGDVEEAQVARARQDVLALFYRERQTLSALASDAARWLYRGQGLEQGERFPARVAAVTRDDIRTAAATLTSSWTCVTSTPNDPVQRAREFLRRYPGATPQDVYKVIMQGVAGPAHLAHEVEQMERDLACEWESLVAEPGELWRPIAINADWGWLDLRAWKARGGSLERVRHALRESVCLKVPQSLTISQAWQSVVAAVRAGALPLDAAAVARYDQWLAQHDYPVVHHSAAFIELYRPAYRVLSEAAWEAAAQALARSNGNMFSSSTLGKDEVTQRQR